MKCKFCRKKIHKHESYNSFYCNVCHTEFHHDYQMNSMTVLEQTPFCIVFFIVNNNDQKIAYVSVNYEYEITQICELTNIISAYNSARLMPTESANIKHVIDLNPQSAITFYNKIKNMKAFL